MLDEKRNTMNPRFKKLKDAQEALKSRDYSKAEKPCKKGYRNARYEIAFVKP